MRFIRYTSVLCLSLIGFETCAHADSQVSRPVYMTSQIQRLLNEKQEKISKLEECDGKRKGFMIAGISTIGLTAVGVGVNIAQASKSNKLSNQIADQNRQLEKQQATLADINAQISDKQNENKQRRECEEKPGMQWVNGYCIAKAEQTVRNTPAPVKEYDGKIGEKCDEGKVWFGTLGTPATKKCLGIGMARIIPCECIPALRYDGQIGRPCTGGGAGAVWTAGGNKKCLPYEDAMEAVDCSCPGVNVLSSQNQGTVQLVSDLTSSTTPVNLIDPVISTTPANSPRVANITGYCLNEEGDTVIPGETGDYCWCDVNMPDYCNKSRLFDDQAGVCTGDETARKSACESFCKSKEQEFRDWCDSLQK